nr:translation initiation factor eif-2b subunit gamma [Quercus suber]
MPSPGLQAFILCGPGVSLNTFTSNPKDFPKALVPIANRPMVWYPLDWCYRMGISDITLITPAESAPPLEAALKLDVWLTSLPSPKPDIIAPEDLTQTSGTGDILRLPQVRKRITSDFVILPCDLLSEMDGAKLIQQWMTLSSPASSGSNSNRKGGLAVFYPTYGLESISHKKDETDFVATVPLPSPPVPAPPGSLRPNVEELVLNMPTDTLNDKLEEGKGFLRLRQSLLNKHARVKLRMKYRDSHIYIFPKWVKDFAAANERFDSISEDLLGWWAKATWQDGLGAKLGLDDILADKKAHPSEIDGDATEELIDMDPARLSSTKTLTPSPSEDLASSTLQFASRTGSISLTTTPTSLLLPSIHAYIAPVPTPTVPQPLIRRIDTTHQLLSVSLHLAKSSPAPTPAAAAALAHEHKIHPTAHIGLQARVALEDSLVGENATLGPRANVKESVVGPNCVIGANARLTRCLLMDGVHVGDGVQLTGCIIGRRARIEGVAKPPPQMTTTSTEGPATAAAGEVPPTAAAAAKKGKRKKGEEAEEEQQRTKLTDCEVAPHFVVEAGTEAKGEKLMAFDTEDLEGLDLDDDADDDDDEEGLAEEEDDDNDEEE